MKQKHYKSVEELKNDVMFLQWYKSYKRIGGNATKKIFAENLFHEESMKIFEAVDSITSYS